MPFLPPSQQRQSTEGKKGEHKKHKRRTLVTLKILFFVEQENA